jgi:hypothetical protein
MPPSFLSGLLGSVGGGAEAKAWQAVQSDSLKAFGSYSFSAGMLDLEGLLLQLDTITSQQALVQMMVGGLRCVTDSAVIGAVVWAWLGMSLAAHAAVTAG